MTVCPVPFETLVALWAVELPEPEATAVEEHVFGCDACAAAHERLGALVAGIRSLVPPVLSRAHRDRLVATGTRVLQTPVDAGVDARARFGPDVDLLVHVLRGDVSRADRVDVEVLSRDGTPHLHFEHVPFDRDAGEVLIACQRHYRDLLGASGDPVFRVYSVEGAERRLVGDYFVEHIWE